MPGGWDILVDLMATLAGAFLLGSIMERFHQSAVLGYILAGVVLGPGLLGVVQDVGTVHSLAELGVALLLFSIGLEFSWKDLVKLGRVGLGGGSLQVLLTMGVTLGLAAAFGLEFREAVALGAIVALSSTVVVMKALKDIGDLDSTHGKASVGVLIFQDIAFVPLVLLLTMLGGQVPKEASSTDLGPVVGQSLVGAVVLIFVGLGFLPRILRSRAMARNRELPILLAVIVCMGSAWAAHTLGFSAAIGAFVGGILLSETSYADQIRADVGPLRTLFATMFFASVGMLANATWIGNHIGIVLLVTVGIVLGKTVLAFSALRVLQLTTIASFAAGICLAQVGELSFVLLQVAGNRNLLDPAGVQLVTSASVLSLAVCPFLVKVAPGISRSLAMRFLPVQKLAIEERRARGHANKLEGHVVVVGFGEAGSQAAADLRQRGLSVLVLETDQRLVQKIRDANCRALLGDATQAEILEGANLSKASGLLVALSDHRSARVTVSQARKLAPNLPIVARVRYHLFRNEVESAGANRVVDEETEVAHKLAEEMADQLGLVWD